MSDSASMLFFKSFPKLLIENGVDMRFIWSPVARDIMSEACQKLVFQKMNVELNITSNHQI